MDTHGYEKAIKDFRKSKILVVGDIMLDHYIHGYVERISPEAPVPIVVEMSHEYILGGAANVAANIASLGGRVSLMGRVGNDAEAGVVKKICGDKGIRPYLIKDGEYPTNVKMRIISARHQLARLDRTPEICSDVSSRVEREVARVLRARGSHDLVVLSDYGKGFMTKNIVQSVVKKFGKDKVVIGLKPSRATLYKNSGKVVILNLSEGRALTGIAAVTDAAAARAVKKLSQFFNASVVLTRGEFGMTVYEKDSEEQSAKVQHIPTRAVRVYDVTGAGDTALAAIALMIARGAGLHDAAEIGNVAAGIVVGIEKTATANIDAVMEVVTLL